MDDGKADARAAGTGRHPDAHSVIVRLSEGEYQFLKATARLHGVRTVAAAVHSCVASAMANVDAKVWNDAPNRGSRRGHAGADQQPIELLVFDEVYPRNRRLKRRYSMQIPATVRIQENPGALIDGVTRNISSTGVLLMTADPISPNDLVRVSVDWPLPSCRGKRLALFSSGKVVWQAEGLAGLCVENWEFSEAIGRL